MAGGFPGDITTCMRPGGQALNRTGNWRISFVGSNALHNDMADDAVTLVKGEGVFVYDEAGKRYLDAVGGVGVVNIGHGVEEVVQAIAEQSRR
jgi:acetylornithine/succinyldiaminopimelate/putrescine aminotransferase